MQSDPLADFLTALRNASVAAKKEVVAPYSRLKHDVAKVLQTEGYLGEVEKTLSDKKKNVLKVTLRAVGKTRSITTIKRVSKPGLRNYVGADEIPRVLGGLGIAVISTSQGVMAGHVAKKRRLGGELLLTIS
jgi:small subunit ribosomal protein S8